MERDEEGSASMRGRLSPGLATLKRQESLQYSGKRRAAGLALAVARRQLEIVAVYDGLTMKPDRHA
jgi:hypothetical protein